MVVVGGWLWFYQGNRARSVTPLLLFAIYEGVNILPGFIFLPPSSIFMLDGFWSPVEYKMFLRPCADGMQSCVLIDPLRHLYTCLSTLPGGPWLLWNVCLDRSNWHGKGSPLLRGLSSRIGNLSRPTLYLTFSLPPDIGIYPVAAGEDLSLHSFFIPLLQFSARFCMSQSNI